MTKVQKKEVKQVAWKLYQDRRISLKMAIWAMKNEETAEWLELENISMENGAYQYA
jgi:hypothetical protein